MSTPQLIYITDVEYDAGVQSLCPILINTPSINQSLTIFYLNNKVFYIRSLDEELEEIECAKYAGVLDENPSIISN